MRVLHIGNLANNGFILSRGLRALGVEAELVIEKNATLAENPLWEISNVKADPYDFSNTIWSEHQLPDWVKLWDGWKGRPPLAKIKSMMELFRLVKEYDILHLHPPFSAYLQFSGKPFVVHEAGWIRQVLRQYLGTRDSSSLKLGRRAYHTADCVVWTNPDTKELVEAVRPRRMKFIPYAIDTDRYSPSVRGTERRGELVFLHPTRQSWIVKGNDRLLRAFSRFIHDGYKARLVLCDWGWLEDVEAARSLIAEEGLERNVSWTQPLSKPSLIEAYNEADVVFDQFLLGSGGAVCYEAMSCARPPVVYLEPKVNTECFGEMPPVINVQTEDEIYEAMTRLVDDKFRAKVGASGRKFVEDHMTPERVAKETLRVYEGIVS